jgi:TatA/E family protein of Tat protein translocase
MTATIVGSDTLIVVIVAVVVLFGGSQLPKLAKNVGAAGRELRNAQKEAEAAHASVTPTQRLAPPIAETSASPTTAWSSTAQEIPEA